MECSDKNVIIPPGMPAKVVQGALLEQGVIVRIAAHGKDVGVDITGGHKKLTKTLDGRANAVAKRARNVHELTKHNSRAKVPGPTGVETAQVYGGTAVGVDEAIIKKQKQNMAAASGKGLRKGASATIAIEWAWGQKAQPDVRAHMGHIEAWLRYFDEHKGEDIERIKQAWKTAYNRAAEASKQD